MVEVPRVIPHLITRLDFKWFTLSRNKFLRVVVLQGGTISIPWDCMRNTNPGPHRRLKGSEILGVEPSHQLHQPSRQFWSTLELENHWLRRWRIAFIEGSHRCAPAVKGVPDKKSPDLCESSWSTCLVSPEHCVDGEWPSTEGPHPYHLAFDLGHVLTLDFSPRKWNAHSAYFTGL